MLGPPGTGKTHLAIAIGIRACLAGQRVAFATATEWVARLGDAKRQGRLEDELDPPGADPAARRRRGRLHPLRPRGGEPDVQPRLRSLRAGLDDRHLEQGLQRLGRDLRRRGDRGGDDRPARPPRRDPGAQGRQLPASRQGPRLAAAPTTDRLPACFASPYGLRYAGGLPTFGGSTFNRRKGVSFQLALTPRPRQLRHVGRAHRGGHPAYPVPRFASLLRDPVSRTRSGSLRDQRSAWTRGRWGARDGSLRSSVEECGERAATSAGWSHRSWKW